MHMIRKDQLAGGGKGLTPADQLTPWQPNPHHGRVDSPHSSYTRKIATEPFDRREGGIEVIGGVHK
jgi:hypothetical protein